MLTAECTETADHVRTCLAPGDAPWSAERPRRVSPAAPGAAMPVIPQQQVSPAAPEAAAIRRPPSPVTPVAQAPVLPPPPVSQADSRIRQRFLFQFGPFHFVTPPIVVGRRQ